MKKLVVGCALYNANPSFLERSQGQAGFKVVLDTTEVFHPKVYLFRVGTAAVLFVGSSNLTGGGLMRLAGAKKRVSKKNLEANVLLHGSEVGPIAEAAAYIGARHIEATKPQGKLWTQWLSADRAAWLKKQNSTKVPRISPPKNTKVGPIKLPQVGQTKDLRQSWCICVHRISPQHKMWQMF